MSKPAGHDFCRMKVLWDNREILLRDIAAEFGLSQSSITRYAKRLGWGLRVERGQPRPMRPKRPRIEGVIRLPKTIDPVLKIEESGERHVVRCPVCSTRFHAVVHEDSDCPRCGMTRSGNPRGQKGVRSW